MTKDERNVRVYALKDNWKELLEALGLDFLKAYYYPKPVMKKTGQDPYINVFPRELARGENIYTEPVDFNMNPEAQRKLYMLKPNPFYEQEFQTMDTPIGEQYIVPFSELIEVKMPEKKKDPILSTIIDISGDCNVQDLSGRDWACIHLKVAASEKGWLNDLIKLAGGFQTK